MNTNPEEEDGWIKPTDKMDASGITISSKKQEEKIIPEVIEKKIGSLSYQAGDTFQIGKNGKAILNRKVPVGHQFTVYIRIIIEETS